MTDAVTLDQLELLQKAPDSPTTYAPVMVPSLDQWADDGRGYIRNYSDLPWKLGSWLSYGEEHWGQECYGALPDAPVHALESLRNFIWVHDNVPVHVRRSELSWSHHQIIAKLDMAQQTMWLGRCVDEGWTVREFREQVSPKKEIAAAPKEEEAPPTPEPPTLEQRREVVIKHTLGRIGLMWRYEDQVRLRRLLTD